MSDLHSNCYRTASTGTLRVEQDSKATEERTSRITVMTLLQYLTLVVVKRPVEVFQNTKTVKHKNNKTQKQ